MSQISPDRPTIDAEVWSSGQKIAFRIAFVFFVLLIVPTDWRYYQFLLKADWLSFSFYDFFRLITYSPGFLPANDLPLWGLASFANLFIILAIAVVGGLLWTRLDADRNEYSKPLYWLRVLVRYRLVAGLMAYGFLKLFKVQMPVPTISDLHTEYGYFLKWKIYYLSTGAATAYYEQALGLLEIAGALLLLCRRTVVIGAGLIAALLFNIILSNFAYQIGNHVYAVSLMLLTLFLLVFDVPRLYSMLGLEKPTRAHRPGFVLGSPKATTVHVIAKSILVMVLTAYAVSGYALLNGAVWPFAGRTGLPGKAGFYNVSDFQINGHSLPYSLTDSLRWQNVVIEEWNTLSIKINRPVSMNLVAPDQLLSTAHGYDFEQSGNGSRHFYSFTADSARHLLNLRNKQLYTDSLVLAYRFPNDATIVLSGRNAANDTISIVLEKIEKKYLLREGHRKPQKIY